MKHLLISFLVALLTLVLAAPFFAQQAVNDKASPSPANPEMARLAKTLVGDWNSTETMERGPLFPAGGSRHGTVHVRLASGGNTLIYEVHSDGSAGKLDGFHIIWFDRSTNLYYFFACFNDPDHPCRMRGTARWERDAFVNDYNETIDGKETHWRDTFTFAPSSHTLVAAMDTGNGAMKTIITTRATRR
jgi:hypothetical protein